MQKSLELMHTSVNNWTQTAGHRNHSSWDQDNHPWHHFEENQSEAVLRALALEEIEKHYQTASWTHIYTDGSAENGTRNGGCGAYIKRPGKPPFSVSAPSGILCSHYRAEVLALLNATETIISWEEKAKKAVFVTDSLSALQAFMSSEPDITQKKLTENISTLAQSACVVLQWI